MNDYFNDGKKIVNQLYYNSIIKMSFENLVNLYFDQLLKQIKANFPNNLKAWEPKKRFRLDN